MIAASARITFPDAGITAARTVGSMVIADVYAIAAAGIAFAGRAMVAAARIAAGTASAGRAMIAAACIAAGMAIVVQIDDRRIAATAASGTAAVSTAGRAGRRRTGSGIIRKTTAGSAQTVQRTRFAAAIAGITICHFSGLLSLGFGVYYSAAKEWVPAPRKTTNLPKNTDLADSDLWSARSSSLRKAIIETYGRS